MRNFAHPAPLPLFCFSCGAPALRKRVGTCGSSARRVCERCTAVTGLVIRICALSFLVQPLGRAWFRRAVFGTCVSYSAYELRDRAACSLSSKRCVRPKCQAPRGLVNSNEMVEKGLAAGFDTSDCPSPHMTVCDACPIGRSRFVSNKRKRSKCVGGKLKIPLMTETDS